MATSVFDNLARIVNPQAPHEHRVGAMRDFAKELDWTPSYEFETATLASLVSDHLVVEHGLENSAIISFVKEPHRTNEFNREQLRALLAISYNNLIEWHIFVSASDVRLINNLSFPESDANFQLIAKTFLAYCRALLSKRNYSSLLVDDPSIRAMISLSR